MQAVQSFLTLTGKSINGEGVTRVACARVRTVGVDANLLADVDIFVAFMDFCMSNHYNNCYIAGCVWLTFTSHSIGRIYPVSWLAATCVGARSIDTDLLARITGVFAALIHICILSILLE